MVKKGVKRPVEGSEAVAKPQGKPQEQSLKKLKVKNTAGVANGVPSKKPKNENKTNSQVPSAQVKKPKTAIESKPKPKNLKQKPQNAPKPAGEEKKEKVLDVVQKRLAAKEKKKQKLQKAKENGQTKVENQLSVEDIKARIEEIKSREVVSKTAARRLGALKKKLRIAEGTYTPNFDNGPKLPENLKRKLRRHKKALERREKAEKIGAVPVNEKQKVLEEKAKTVSQLVQQERNKQVVAAVKTQTDEKNKKGQQAKQQKGQQQKKKVVKAESSDSDDSDDVDDEEEDEIEDDSDEEEDSQAADSTLNTSQEDDSDENAKDDEEDDDDSEDEEEEEEEVEEEEKKPQIQPKKAKIEPKIEAKVQKVENNKNVKTGKPDQQKPAADKKNRYVLFVGNLPYTVTQEEIRKHFLTKVSAISSVRIPNERKTNKPRGFAYVELTNSEDYEKGLSLHQSDLQGRKINVQYTSGGSKSSGKNPEVIAKNKKLHAMRKQGMLAGSVKESNKRSIRRKKQKTQAA